MQEKMVYSIEELAEIFDCSKDTVRRWIKSGNLNAMHVGRFVRVSHAQLEQFIADNAAAERDRAADQPRTLTDADGAPRYLDGDNGGPFRLARTDQPGKYAVIDDDGKETGLFVSVLGL